MDCYSGDRIRTSAPRYATSPASHDLGSAAPRCAKHWRYVCGRCSAAAHFIATAYCKGTITRSGIPVRSGMAAGDPSILPLGSVIRVESAGAYTGLYTILDTGPAIQGRMIDIYMWSCYEALAFGRRPLDITILRLGWKPVDSASDRIDAAFRQREWEWRPKSLYSRPLNLNDPAER